MSSSPAIILSPADNVAVVRRNVSAGEPLAMESATVVARDNVPLGHKIARRLIPRGAEVIKYGMSIGSTSVDIRPGEWVHVHNIRGDYVTHTGKPGAQS